MSKEDDAKIEEALKKFLEGEKTWWTIERRGLAVVILVFLWYGWILPVALGINGMSWPPGEDAQEFTLGGSIVFASFSVLLIVGLVFGRNRLLSQRSGDMKGRVVTGLYLLALVGTLVGALAGKTIFP